MIRPATDGDLESILAVHRAAFPQEDVAGFTRSLLADPSAGPMVSLVALAEDRIVGHVLFTAARLEPETGHRVAILAPLGVLPQHQGVGIGGGLVSRGLALLEGSGVGMVFVLGHPSYYPRFGFAPADALGFAAPYPIPEEVADAWMVLGLDLADGLPRSYAGTVKCAEAMDRPEHWRE